MIQRCDCENMHLCVLSEKNKHFSSLQDQYILKHLFFLSRTHTFIFFQSIRWIMLYYRCVGSVFFSGFLRTFTPSKTLTSSVASYCRKSYSFYDRTSFISCFDSADSDSEFELLVMGGRMAMRTY